jgi:hypothetical protein
LEVTTDDTFYVMEKDGQYFIGIENAHEKKIQSGPFDYNLVWLEHNRNRLDRMRLEYDFLSDWNIVKVHLQTTERFTFEYSNS